MIIQNPCSPQYIRDQKGAGWMLNVVPVRADFSISGGVWKMYCPRPWIIIGIANMSPSAANYPRYADARVSVSPADMNTYHELFQNIFLDCAFATMHESDPATYVVNYLEPGIQKIDYRGYFTRYFGNDAMQTPEQWYYAINQPESMVVDFAVNEAATALVTYMEKWRDLILYLTKTINQKMMGSPGVYTFTQGVGISSPSWSSQTVYELYFNA